MIMSLNDPMEKEIAKLRYSIIDQNPFKMAKRIWSLARMRGDNETLEKIYPLVTGNISLCYQLKGDIDILINLYEKIRNFPLAMAIQQLEMVKSKLPNVLEMTEVYMNEVFSFIDKAIEAPNGYTFFRNCVKSKDLLSKFIDDAANKYLSEIGFFYPPPAYLPNPMRYKYTYVPMDEG